MGVHVLNIDDIKLDFLESATVNKPKYFDAIHNIYLAYRTCYSKTPEIEKEFTEDEKNKLKRNLFCLKLRD